VAIFVGVLFNLGIHFKQVIDKADVILTGVRVRVIPRTERKNPDILNCGRCLGFARHDSNNGYLLQVDTHVIVQPTLMRSMMIPNGFPVEGFHIVDELKFNVDEAAMQKLDATSDLICVDHYYTKSHDEWLEKMKRGSADPNYSRKYGEFFYFNPDLKGKEAYEETVPEQEYAVSKKIAPQRIVIRNMYNGG
jgi:hypothetical protein